MKALRGSLFLSFIVVAQLAFFAPATQAATRYPKHPTSQCTGTLTLTGRLGTITKALSFVLIGTFSGPFGFSYSAVVGGITYSATASGTCTPV